MGNPYFKIFIFGLSVATTLAHAEGTYPVAGTTPWQRPAGAPVIEWVRHDQGWYEHALTGISPPYPRSLYFLDNQGNWYTPFNRPGMLPPYDIRGWHRAR
jgi:hypothetical protein